jgi:hypothetical protein
LGIILKSFVVEGVLEVLESKGIVEDLDSVLSAITDWGVSQKEGRQTICDGILLSLANNWAGRDGTGSGQKGHDRKLRFYIDYKGTKGVTNNKSNDCDKAKHDRGLKSDETGRRKMECL